MPVQIPMGGLLMMSIVSPTFNGKQKKTTSHANSRLSTQSEPCIGENPRQLDDLEFEGFSVVRTGDEIGVDPGSTTELARVGRVLVQSQDVSVTEAIRPTGDSTCITAHKEQGSPSSGSFIPFLSGVGTDQRKERERERERERVIYGQLHTEGFMCSIQSHCPG